MVCWEVIILAVGSIIIGWIFSLSGIALLGFVLYFVIKIAVKNGIIEAKKELDKK